ncbi:hypothetical protein QNM97_01615 [Gordonia sp. L191]|uniref:hypothetical protein n=1 Tax=Gordonia sp. L191 TaxID=2982699 RepID=UPI0024C00E29|nr:hypothetical protein [Gordonia sp. L191]WHU47740.1 hypothetical protein QNM97_01615 [Gordonia sp. L191]
MPVIAIVFVWRLARLLLQRLAVARQPLDRTHTSITMVYGSLTVFALATYFGTESDGREVFTIRVWLVWLEYLAIMAAARALAQAFGAKSHRGGIVISGVAMIGGCLAAATPAAWTGTFVNAPATLLWLYFVCTATYIPACLGSIAVSIARHPRAQGSLLHTTVMIGVGAAGLSLGIALNAVEFAIYLTGHRLPPLIETVSRALLDAGLLLLVIGTLAPGILGRLAYLKRTFNLTRELHAMSALDAALSDILPSTLGPPQQRVLLTPGSIRLAHYCRYIRIRDALTLLSPAIDDPEDPRQLAEQLVHLLKNPIAADSGPAQPILSGDDNDDWAPIITLSNSYRAAHKARHCSRWQSLADARDCVRTVEGCRARRRGTDNET